MFFIEQLLKSYHAYGTQSFLLDICLIVRGCPWKNQAVGGTLNFWDHIFFINYMYM